MASGVLRLLDPSHSSYGMLPVIVSSPTWLGACRQTLAEKQGARKRIMDERMSNT